MRAWQGGVLAWCCSFASGEERGESKRGLTGRLNKNGRGVSLFWSGLGRVLGLGGLGFSWWTGLGSWIG